MSQQLNLDCSAACANCGRLATGVITLDEDLTIIDSVGLLLVGSFGTLGVVCDVCVAQLGMPGDEPFSAEATQSENAQLLASFERAWNWNGNR